jgi:large subunit ribosomal protein L6
MSRTGKLPIEYSNNTQISSENGIIKVKGPKGELSQQLHSVVSVDINDGQVHVKVQDPDDRRQRALWGLFRSLVNNMVQGVEEGFQKQLEVNGVGYKAAMKGDDTVILNVGFSHPVEYKLPEGVSALVEGNVITISGIDKQLVGKAAAQIKNIKKAEPYKGKGLKYVGEEIKRKEGKTGSK